MMPKMIHRERPHVDRRLSPADLDGATLVQRAIEHSGLTDAAFAATVLRCSRATLYRYLRGATTPNARDRDFLVAYVSTPLKELA